MRSTTLYNKGAQITLVGAGPGDPELITLKGLRALQTADVVLYDALISASLLDYLPNKIPAISVGKRAGSHSLSQQEINELLVESAKLYGHAVRLKGGDPYVFGRGHEELDYAELHGIPVTVVPGISSAIAVPASVNIPVTKRNLSDSFWVMTGTTQSGNICDDIAVAAQSNATVVILMGLNKIQEIMDCFRQQGKANVPVAIIQNGTLPTERCLIGTVADIAARAEAEGMSSPAVIIIGEVVRCATSYKDLITTRNVAEALLA